MKVGSVLLGLVYGAPIDKENKEADIGELIGTRVEKATGTARGFYRKVAMDALNWSAFVAAGGKIIPDEDDEKITAKKKGIISFLPPSTSTDEPQGTLDSLPTQASAYKSISNRLSSIGNIFSDPQVQTLSQQADTNPQPAIAKLPNQAPVATSESPPTSLKTEVSKSPVTVPSNADTKAPPSTLESLKSSTSSLFKLEPSNPTETLSTEAPNTSKPEAPKKEGSKSILNLDSKSLPKKDPLKLAASILKPASAKDDSAKADTSKVSFSIAKSLNPFA